MIVNWRKWGLGLSVEFNDPAFLRLWIGPRRVLKNLEAKGLVERVCYVDDHAGYLYRRAS